MYVAVKGGEAAILATHDLVAEARRGDPAVPESPSPRSASSRPWPAPA